MRESAFPTLEENVKQRAHEKLGHSLDDSFRKFLGSVTGKDGDELEELIAAGNEAAREVDEEYEKELTREARKVHALNTYNAPSSLASINSHRYQGELLTNRQLIVLQAFADGLTTPEVAAECNCAVETVKSHAKLIRKRMGVPTMNAAVAVGVASGLIVAPHALSVDAA